MPTPVSLDARVGRSALSNPNPSLPTAMNSTSAPPAAALTLGAPAGIDPELIAKQWAQREAGANVAQIGDRWLLEEGRRLAALLVAANCPPS